MKAVAPLIAALVLAAAAGTLVAGVAVRRDAGPTRDAARAALLAWDGRSAKPGDTPDPPADARGRYWWALSAFERMLSSNEQRRAERLRALESVATELAHLAGRGSGTDRSRALSLLALARLTRLMLDADPTSHANQPPRLAVTALQAAVVLDPDNADAKANLEQLLRTSPTHSMRAKSKPGVKSTRGKRPLKRPAVTTPVSGAGKGVKRALVGY
jgi:hypothetical protein